MRTHPGSTGISALQAFRADLPLGGGAGPNDEDGAILMTATLLRQGASLPARGRDARRLFAAAARLGENLLGPAALAYGSAYDPPHRRSAVDTMRMVAERAEDRGHLSLADNILESVLARVDRGSVSHGRITFQRARIAAKRGFLDLAHAQYVELQRTAELDGEDELVILANLGLALLAQLRGNYPEMRDRAATALPLAERNGFTRLTSASHSCLAVPAAVAGDFDTAVVHTWQAHQLGGPDGRRTQELLTNVGQMLYEAGHPGAARHAFASVLRSTTRPRTILPALGGYALASAEVGDLTATRWAADRVMELARARAHPYQIASALLECASALARTGAVAPAGTLRRRAAKLAGQHGFHEIVLRADAAERPQSPPAMTLSTASAEVVDFVRDLGPETLPAGFELVAAE